MTKGKGRGGNEAREGCPEIRKMEGRREEKEGRKARQKGKQRKG